MMNYPADLEIEPLAKPVNTTVGVPGSKSITNRALVLAALTSMDVPLVLEGALQSEDTELMVNALQQLGYAVKADWPNSRITFAFQDRPRVPAKSAQLFVGNSGTSMRFLTAMLATGEGRWRLDGIPRMRERPIRDLLDALNQFDGVTATSEAGNGCPPVIVESTGLKGGRVRIRADVSSQFLSALLMAAPFAETPVELEVQGTMVSEPYIEMTMAMMKDWGYPVERAGNSYRVAISEGNHNPARYTIEPDASAASYFFAAAAITGGTVTVRGMKRNMLQGDVKFVDALESMGCRVEHSEEGITVQGGPLRGIDIDMNAISDTVMTLAAVACFAAGPTTIRNVGHIRHKETDRIAAVANELRKFGIPVEEYAEGMKITPGPMHGAKVETYNDHRMAMSLALVGLRVPGVVILNPGCVVKTYPGFWADFAALES